MKRLNIVQSKDAPTDGSSLWLLGTELKTKSSNGWQSIGNIEAKASVEKVGLVKKAKGVCQLDVTATKADIINTINSLIVKLQAAGIME